MALPMNRPIVRALLERLSDYLQVRRTDGDGEYVAESIVPGGELGDGAERYPETWLVRQRRPDGRVTIAGVDCLVDASADGEPLYSLRGQYAVRAKRHLMDRLFRTYPWSGPSGPSPYERVCWRLPGSLAILYGDQATILRIAWGGEQGLAGHFLELAHRRTPVGIPEVLGALDYLRGFETDMSANPDRSLPLPGEYPFAKNLGIVSWLAHEYDEVRLYGIVTDYIAGSRQVLQMLIRFRRVLR